jgi:hypothetical protein
MPKTTETKLKATPQFIGARILLCQTLNLGTIFFGAENDRAVQHVGWVF